MGDSPLPYIITGATALLLGFAAGTLLVLYCRRRSIDKSGSIYSQRLTTEVSRGSENAADLESQINSMSNVLEGFITKDVAIFEINVNYNDQMLNVVQHSEHEVRIEQYKKEVGYIPAIVTFADKEQNEEGEEEYLPYTTKLVYCDGTKEPQYNIYISHFNEDTETAKPIFGLCVHERALKVFELVKRQKKQHHMLMQRSRNGNEPFTTIFVGCAKGVVNVKHNQTGVFRLLIWWSLVKE